MADIEPERPTAKSLVARVRVLLNQEFAGFHGLCEVALRVDGEPPDRSVFAVVHLRGCESVAIARVYEADLPGSRRDMIQVLYLTTDDAALLHTALAPHHSRSSRKMPPPPATADKPRRTLLPRKRRGARFR